jgi:hypothetical protein
MASMEQAKEIAKEIQEILGSNHVSTMVHGQFLDYGESDGASNIPLLIVVKKFDEGASLKIFKVLKKWSRIGVETPYVAELDDLSGMLDSIPSKLLDIKTKYVVLEGQDILELKTEPEFEYLRAQVELEIRRTIYNLRHDLIDVMLRKIAIDAYLKNLALACLASIKSYHLVLKPEIKSNNQHLEYFYREFPTGKKYLTSLLEVVYAKERSQESDLLELITNVIDEVVQPLLVKVDQAGRQIIDYKMKKVEDIIEAKTREMRLEMLKEKMDLVKQRKEVAAFESQKINQLDEKKKQMEKEMDDEKKKQIEAQKHPFASVPISPEYFERMLHLQEERAMSDKKERAQATQKEKLGSEDIPVHEKELSVFEKILYENKTIKNTIPKQTQRRHSA